MSSLVPWLSVLAIAAGGFLVGKYFQAEERKQHELRKQKRANLASSIAGLHSATQAMNPRDNPQGLGRVIQDQQVQSRYTH
jgi:hypothetical protein